VGFPIGLMRIIDNFEILQYMSTPGVCKNVLEKIEKSGKIIK
jgi:hypothetical protein